MDDLTRAIIIGDAPIVVVVSLRDRGSTIARPKAPSVVPLPPTYRLRPVASAPATSAPFEVYGVIDDDLRTLPFRWRLGYPEGVARQICRADRWGKGIPPKNRGRYQQTTKPETACQNRQRLQTLGGCLGNSAEHFMVEPPPRNICNRDGG